MGLMWFYWFDAENKFTLTLEDNNKLSNINILNKALL